MLASSTIESLWDWLVNELAPNAQKFTYAAFAVMFVAFVAVGIAAGIANRRGRKGARYVDVRPPSTGGSLEAAAGFWRQVAGTVAPRRWGWRPCLAFEIRASANALRLGLWVPAGVDAVQVARKAETAWHGAQARVTDPPALPGQSAAAAVQHGVAGRMLRPVRATRYAPLRVDPNDDQLLEVFAHGLALPPGETLMVQVVARPLRIRQVEHLRKKASDKAAGKTWWTDLKANSGMSGQDLGDGLRQVWYGTDSLARAGEQSVSDAVGPSVPRQRRAQSPGSDRAARFDAAAPEEVREEQRTVRRRFARGPVWQVSIRVYGFGDPADRYAVGSLAGSFGAYTDLGSLRPSRLPAAARVLERRSLSGLTGFEVNNEELAALAHLPYDSDHPGLEPASTIARQARADLRDRDDGTGA